MNQENTNTGSESKSTRKPRKQRTSKRKNKASKVADEAVLEMILNPSECRKFAQGHHLHYIGHRVVRERGGFVPVTGLRVEGNWVTAEIDGEEVLRAWHHDAKLLKRFFLRIFNAGGEVRIQPGSAYLMSEGTLITVCPDGPSPCQVSSIR